MAHSSSGRRVLLAAPRGFCAGVVRAVATVDRALRAYGPPIYVYHEIIHNQHAVAALRDKGAVFIDDLEDVPVLHSEVEWEWIASSAVMADHGSGLMDLTPQRAGNRSRDAHRADQCGRSQQPTDRRGRQRQEHRVQQTA